VAEPRSDIASATAHMSRAEIAWFWSEGHQAAEREADGDLEAGRHQDLDDADRLLAHLEGLDDRAER
jgi:hypothetical protein